VADYLLDTSFLIGYFNEVSDGVSGPARRFRATLPDRARFFVSIVSLAELIEGADDAFAVERELQQVARLLGLHHRHANRAGRLQKRAQRDGRRLGENDAWIAATAVAAQLTVIGDDDRAFANRTALAYLNFRTAAV
jgi:predicted nucleic acid-binding protein